MRIALDATYSLGQNLSGVGVYSRQILHGLAAAHPEADLLFCYRPQRLLRSLREPLPPNCRRRLLQEPLAPRADLFHALNQRLPRARLRIAVSTFHDLFVLTGEYSSAEFRRRFQAQARYAAEHSDRIIAVSQFTARQVEELLGVERARLRVVPHGVRFPAEAPAAAREPLVLHVGAIQKRKNVARLVKAFAQVPGNWRLLLAGSLGYGGQEILAEIGSSPCRERIEVLGWVDDRTLAALYRRASILAFPSLDEGFGVPVLEAMAAGTPVLTSNRSALPEVCGDAALLVDPTEIEAIGNGLRELAGNRLLREELGRRGRIRASGFTWESAVSRTWSVYRELLG